MGSRIYGYVTADNREGGAPITQDALRLMDVVCGLASQLCTNISAQHRREEILGAAIHAFKTPCSNVLALVEGLLPDVPDRSKSDDIIRYIVDERERLIRVGKRVKNFLSSGVGLVYAKGSVSLDELAQNVVRNMTATEGSSRGIEIEYEVTPNESFDIIGDRDYLYIALEELLQNAVKAVVLDGTISVSLARDGDSVILAVSNGGRALPEGFSLEALSSLPEIAHPVQYPQSVPADSHLRERNFDFSFGIGLSIAKTIAKAHGGELTSERGPAKTVFRLKFPC